MIKKYLVFSILYLVLFGFAIYHIPDTIYSASATPSATKTASPSSSLLDKINQIKQEVSSKAAQLKTSVNQKLNNKFFWGKVLSKSEESLSLATTSQTKFVNISEFTQYMTGKSRPKESDIKADDYIAALGDIDDKGHLTAKRIIKIKEPRESKQALWGQVQKVSGNTLVLKTKDGQKSVSLGSGISYFYGNQEASSSAMGINSTVVVTGYPKGNLINSTFLYIVPQGVSSVKSEMSTPIPSPSPKK